jgi:adenine-specific DNA-methyltransferase
VVDFYCSAAKLIVELDGGQHADLQRKLYDQNRTRWLEQRGYRVLRFWNIDVVSDSEAGAVLLQALHASGVPLPEPLRGSTLPQGEGTIK